LRAPATPPTQYDRPEFCSAKLEAQAPLAPATPPVYGIAEIHLHGLDREKAALDGRLPDHRPINAADPWLRELRPFLDHYEGVVNLEVFSWEEAAESIKNLKILHNMPLDDPKQQTGGHV
jgi:hypothetical protein